MKHYIYYILLPLVFLINYCALAQASVDSIRISPAQPIKNDYIKIYLYSSTYHVSERINFNQQQSGNTYFFTTCYTMQGSPAATFYADTINVGPLADGTYKIHFTCYRSLDHNQCDYLDTAQDSLIFTVLPPVYIPTISKNSIIIYPNPAGNLLYIKNGSIKEAVIYNTQGITTGHHSGNGPIDISTYPPGIYFIRLSTAEGSHIHRLMKQ